MKLIGMMPCRNEGWVLRLSARTALMWCDALVLLDHESTDDTQEIILDLAEEFGERIITQRVAGKWAEMEHRQLMLQLARQNRATHVAIVDADEVLTGNLLGWIRVGIESLPPQRILQLPGYNLRGGLNVYHANGIWGKRVFSIAFPDDRRLGWSGDHFHQREPAGCPMRTVAPIMQGFGGIMHLWGASEQRLRAKHALYKMTETLRWPAKPHAEIDRMYNQAFLPAANRSFDQTWAYAEVPEAWWDPYLTFMRSVYLEDTPWQQAECRRLYEEHGAGQFAGLDLFGVCEAVSGACGGVAINV